MIPVILRPEAESDIESARTWYAREDERLGIKFVEEFDRTIQRVRKLPLQFPDVGRGVRRALLNLFPYATYFVVRNDVAVVIAVLHLHRRPSAWKKRVTR